MGKMLELDEAVLIEKQLLDAEAAVPCSAALGVAGRGLYSWWDDGGSLDDFLPQDCPHFDRRLPVYVGKAEGSIGTRFAANHLASTRYSSIRRSLAALLYARLDLLPGMTPVGNGKLTMRQAEEDRLTEWMRENLRITCVETAFSPARLEKAIIQGLSPLLNYTHASRSPYRKSMHGARKDMCTAARHFREDHP